MNLRYWMVCFGLLLSACTAPAPPPPEMPGAALLRQLATLPGGDVLAEPVVGVRYAGERLFSSGAALPLAGGVEVLDPLCELLLAQPQLRWTGTVRAKTEFGRDYDTALAAKRLELLQRYLRNRGVAEGQISWQALAGEGPPLELQVPALAQVTLPPSSPTEKR